MACGAVCAKSTASHFLLEIARRGIRAGADSQLLMAQRVQFEAGVSEVLCSTMLPDDGSKPGNVEYLDVLLLNSDQSLIVESREDATDRLEF